MLARTGMLLGALLLSLPLGAQTRDAPVDLLFAQAVRLWSEAQSQPAQRLAALRRVQATLQTIIEQHPGAPLAIGLAHGAQLGPLSMRRIADQIAHAERAQHDACED